MAASVGVCAVAAAAALTFRLIGQPANILINNTNMNIPTKDIYRKRCSLELIVMLMTIAK